MAARILPFRSLVPLEKAVGFTSVAGTMRTANGPRVPATVVVLPKQGTATRELASAAMRAKVEGELAEGYVEVEITGMSLRRLACVYGVILRTAWASATGSVRSRLGLTPAV